jgi:hypothetical protein
VTNKAAKVYGPYHEGLQWRLIVLDGNARKALVYTTEAQALTVREGLLTALDTRKNRTIGDVVD